jgi:hypothetical protein
MDSPWTFGKRVMMTMIITMISTIIEIDGIN